MVEETKTVSLTQYLRYSEVKVKTNQLNLSLTDDEINYHICQHADSSTEIREDFELLTQQRPGLDCLATIHTQNGFACLEAHVPQISLPLLGRNFDGQSAHDFRIRPTQEGEPRWSMIQLRPGEIFYVQDLCFSLVSEGSREHCVQLAAKGKIPTYEEYSQHVSQKEESQALTTPSSCKSDMADPASLETPQMPNHLHPRNTPLIRQVAADALAGKENSQEWPQMSEKNAVLQAVRHTGRPSMNGNHLQAREANGNHVDLEDPETSSPQDQDKEQEPMTCGPECVPSRPTYRIVHHQPPQESDPPANQTNLHTSDFNVGGDPCISETSGSSPVIHDSAHSAPKSSPPPDYSQISTCHGPQTFTSDQEPSRKKRRLSCRQQSEEESQDSLAGKTIQVIARTDNALRATNFQTLHDRQRTRVYETTADPQSPTTPTQASPLNSLAPTSSMRSTRSAFKESNSLTHSQANGIRVLFASSTSVGDSKAFKKFLAEQGVKTVQRVEDATCLCIGKGELKKTSKLISAVLHGLDIVTETWVIDSVRLKTLQSTQDYLPKDTQAESEWGIMLDAAIERGRRKVQVFQGFDIAFTTKAKNGLGKTGFTDLSEIMTQAGAKSLKILKPSDTPGDKPSTIIIGSPEDVKARNMQNVRCFTKNIIGLSILRGRLDLESDEFLIQKQLQDMKVNKKRKR